METNESIASASNSVLKGVRAVLAGKDRDRIVLEGDRLIADALGAGWQLEVILVADDRQELAQGWEARDLPVRRVLPDLLARTSGLKTSPGSLAVAARPVESGLDSLKLPTDALIVVAAGIGDPGNLGALARSAEAAGVSALIIIEGSASPWNSKTLRGSMGSMLRLPVVEGQSAAQVAEGLKARGIRQVAAGTRGGAPFSEFNWSGSVALWMASEAGEMPDVARDFESVSIPMAGGVESLNVAVAGSLLMFAAERWRE
ncbi:MAG: TrmH family RNA methyltransferase [Planctomycetota bacterium]